MPKQFDGEWLRENFPDVAHSMDRFIDKIKEETDGEVIGDLEIIRIPLNLYRARNVTSRQWATAGPRDHPFATTPVFLLGDSAIGSPYFQSISLGFECAMYLAGAHRAARPGVERHARSLRAVHVQAVAARVHAEQDDQEQQGPVPVARRPASRCWTSCTSTRSGCSDAQSRPAGFRSHLQAYLRGAPDADRVRSRQSPRQLGRPVLLSRRLHVHLPDRAGGLREAPRRVPRRGAPCCSRRARTAASATRPGSRPTRGSPTSATR